MFLATADGVAGSIRSIPPMESQLTFTASRKVVLARWLL